MQRIRIDRPGGYDRLQLEQAPDLQAAAGQLRIAVTACGVNFADCAVRMGLYESAKRYVGWPITPGFEVAGVIDQLGPGVVGWQCGQRVMAMTRFGGYASQLLCAPEFVRPIPPGWSDDQAAAWPVAFLTAWYGLYHLGQAQPGEAVLIHSAAGGVGQALVQLARARGCRTLGVVSGAHKVEEVQKLGCDLVVDRTAQDWRAAARAFAPEGMAVVLDANGVETLGDSYNLIGPAGRLIVYGFATMLRRGGSGRPDWLKLAWSWLRTPRFNPLELTTTNRSVLAFNLSFLFDRTDVLARALQELEPLVSSGQLKPLRVSMFDLADAAAAHAALEGGRTTGKLVLTVDRGVTNR